MIERSLLNLLDNAVKFSDGTALIRAIVGVDNAVVFVDILNQGPGVRPEDISILFLPGQRGKGAEVYEGKGMGLAMARQMIVRHGGELTLQNPSNPALFRVSLPLILRLRPKE